MRKGRVKKGMQILAAAVVVSLLSSFGCMAEEGETPAPEKPKLTVTASNINDTYLEVGLDITSGMESFHSAGVVLEFDSTVLEPVRWGGSQVPYDTTGAGSWSGAVPLETVGEKAFSGKTALAYFDGITLESPYGRKGYLYLETETASPLGALNGARSVTAVFKYTEGHSKEDVHSDTIALGSASSALRLASDAAAYYSPLSALAVYFTGKQEAGTAVEYYSRPLTKDAAGSIVENLKIGENERMEEPVMKWIEKGESADTGGGGSAEGMASVSFYDWDDRLMGAIAVPIGAVSEETKQSIQEFQEKFMYASADRDENGALKPDLPLYVDNAAYPLRNKKGYSFAKWIVVTSDTLEDTFTAYATEDEVAAANGTDFANISGNMIVKAGYMENSEINNGRKYYTATAVKNNMGRFGTPTPEYGDYSIVIDIERKNDQNSGITRLKKPALKVVMTTASGTLYSMIEIENKDKTSAEIVVTTATTTVKYNLIDLTENSDWVNYCSNKSAQIDILRDGKDGFVILGTVGDVNRICAEYNMASDNAELTDSEVSNIYRNWNTKFSTDTLKILGVPYLSSQGGPGAANAKRRIYKAIKENNNEPISHDEMAAAVLNSALDAIPNNRT